MIQDQRYCMDVMNQIEAIAAALRRVQADMLRDHINAVSKAAMGGCLSDNDSRELADEVAGLIQRRP